MAIVINGSGTVTGLAVGGLPDGTVDSGTIATGTIVDADVANLAASKLTGALPAISGASLTGITTGQVLQVAVVEDSTREVFSTSADYYPVSGAFTKISGTSKIIAVANIIGHAASAGLCGTGLKLDSTKKYVGGYSDSTSGVLCSGMADFGVVASGSHTIYWGWTTANASATKPFSVLNPNSSEEARSQQKVSTILVYEVEV